MARQIPRELSVHPQEAEVEAVAERAVVAVHELPDE
jgi:hypothetical protein